METKKCSVCKKVKPISEFYKDKSKKDGLSCRCKECDKKRAKKYYVEHLKEERERARKYSEEHRKEKKEYNAKHKEQRREYYQKNKEKILKKQYEYERKKRRKNPTFRLNKNFSQAIWQALKGNKAGRAWKSLVGYSLEKLKKYLEKQFDDKMSWENYGDYWHIDHITPKSAFNYTKPEHIGFKKCWALENLQPLEATKNRKKYNKLLKAKQEHLII